MILLLWTGYNYTVLYYSKAKVTLLTFKPFVWAGYALGVKFVGLITTFILLPYFNCLLSKCETTEWKRDWPYQILLALQVLEYCFLLIFIRQFIHEF